MHGITLTLRYIVLSVHAKLFAVVT